MGASGAGKTTLLNCLNFRNTGKLKIHGQRYLNGASVNTDMLARISGYVQQDDLFVPTLTVKEHLRFHVSFLLFKISVYIDDLLNIVVAIGSIENGQSFDLQRADESSRRGD